MNKSIEVELMFQDTLFPDLESNRHYVFDQEQVMKYPGITKISKLLDQIETEEDFWLVYEVGSETLGARIFDINIDTRPNGE